MSSSPYIRTVTSKKTFEEAVAAVQQESAATGFRVLHIHDVAATLREKGFDREPLTIVEICNARYADEALKKDVELALMLPCPISVYVQGDTTHISTMLPSALATFFPGAGIESLAADVEASVLEIIHKAR